MKVKCTKCNQDKKTSEFYKNTRKSNGFESSCKECVLFSKKRRRQNNRAMKKSNSSKVLDFEGCTWNEVYITRPKSEELKVKDLVEELLWLENQRRYEA